MTDTATAIGPGIYDDLDEATYHRHPDSLSVSGAKVLLENPARFNYQRQNPPPPKDVFELGSAVHAKVLGVGGEVVIVQAKTKQGETYDAKDYNTKAAQDHRDAIRAEGKIPLLRAQAEQVDAMYEALRENKTAWDLLHAPGRRELSLFCTDPETGVLRRGRVDLLTDDNLIVDYKTAFACDLSRFGKSAGDYRYHMQDAWYRDLATDCGIEVRSFLFVAQEKEPPYPAEVYELIGPAVQRGRELNSRALERFRDCTAAGIWPSYNPTGGIRALDIPAYCYADKEL